MQIKLLPNANIPAAPAIGLLVDAADVDKFAGCETVTLNPTVDIVLMNTDGTGDPSDSPFLCPAGVPTVIKHRSGNIYASGSAIATVKVALGGVP